MGCSSSKRSGLETPPMARSQSMPVRRRKEYVAGEHTVALTSSTLGSIKLDHELLRISPSLEAWSEGEEEEAGARRLSRRHSDLSLEVFQARTWSSMMEGKIPIMPRTPVAPPRLSHSLPVTPPEPTPEMINAWELMEGLEDSPPNIVYHTVDRSWPADKAVDETVDQASSPPPKSDEPLPQRPSQESLLLSSPSSESETDSEVSQAPLEKIPKQTEPPTPPPAEPLLIISSPKHSPSPVPTTPLWEQVELEDTLASEFDMDIISDFKKSFQNLTPEQESPLPLLLNPITEHKSETSPAKSMPESKPIPLKTCGEDKLPSSPTGLVKARVMQFQTKINMKRSKTLPPTKSPPDSEGKVVFYFTSLRGVRKTFDDCCRTRLIFKGYDVKLDERDVSMHQRFRLELDDVLNGSGWTLPRVFVKGKHLGGVDDVRRVHETGELEKMLEGCPRVEHGRVPCLGCGDIKFVHCHTCSGSCKVYCEGDGGGDGVFERCPDCNENGIIRCPVCCV